MARLILLPVANEIESGTYIVPLPPSSEQNQIVEWIERNSTEIDSALSNTKCEIRHLLEYRNRLITDVVIGKLDVRNIAMRLPDDPEKFEIVDESDFEISPNEGPIDALDDTLEPIEA